MKFNYRRELFSLIIIAITIVASFYFYLNFPEQVPIHWNFKGEVNGWGSRAFGAFFIPAILIGLYLMFIALPKIDPRKERYNEFGRVYKIFQNLILLFLALIYFLTGFSGLGYNVNISKIVPAFVGILLIVIGNYLGKIKSNFFVGVKTPWTLSSEEVWNKTHRFTGWVFVVGGLILAIIAYIPSFFVLYFLIADILLLVLSPVVYSYIIYQQIKKDSPNNKKEL